MSKEEMSLPPSERATESVRNGVLRWSISRRLSDGNLVEADGVGRPPVEVRNLLVTQNGEWQVHVEQAGPRARIMQVLRQVLTCNLEWAQKATTILPGIIMYGTWGEATLLAEELRSVGVKVSITQRNI